MKALAIGADNAIRIDSEATDGFFVAKQLAEVIKQGQYDLVLAGKESIDYNGGMEPGMVSEMCGFNFVNACIGLEVNGASFVAQREIDGGKETLEGELPAVIAGQKGIVEEKDLRIPNMRGIMMARKKPLQVIPPAEVSVSTQTEKFERPAAKGLQNGGCGRPRSVDRLAPQ